MTLPYTRRPSIHAYARPVDITVTLARVLALMLGGTAAASAAYVAYQFATAPQIWPSQVVFSLVGLGIHADVAFGVWLLAKGVRAMRLWAAIGLIVVGGILGLYMLMAVVGAMHAVDRWPESAWPVILLALPALFLLDLALLLPFAVRSIQSIAVLRDAGQQFPAVGPTSGMTSPPPSSPPTGPANPDVPASPPPAMPSADRPTVDPLPVLPWAADDRRPIARAVLAARVLGSATFLAGLYVGVLQPIVGDNEWANARPEAGLNLLLLTLLVFWLPGVFLLVLAGQLNRLQRSAVGGLIAVGSCTALISLVLLYLYGTTMLIGRSADLGGPGRVAAWLACGAGQLALSVTLIATAVRGLRSIAGAREHAAGRPELGRPLTGREPRAA